MDSVSIVTAVVAACSPIILGVFTWLTRRGLETRAAEETTLDKRLEQQRNDFNSVIVPMQETVKRLQRMRSPSVWMIWMCALTSPRAISVS